MCSEIPRTPLPLSALPASSVGPSDSSVGPSGLALSIPTLYSMAPPMSARSWIYLVWELERGIWPSRVSAIICQHEIWAAVDVVVLRQTRLVIPTSRQQHIIDIAHAAHMDSEKTMSLIGSVQTCNLLTSICCTFAQQVACCCRQKIAPVDKLHKVEHVQLFATCCADCRQVARLDACRQHVNKNSLIFTDHVSLQSEVQEADVCTRRLELPDSQIETLIDLLQKNDCLWKTTSTSYSDRNMRQKAPSEMSTQLEIPG